MANSFAVCLVIFSLFYNSNLSLARQIPKECSKGPEYWCQNLRTASDCGAVGHCIGEVWEHQDTNVRKNEVSEKVVRVFKQLKDVKDLINEDYLATRIRSECQDLPTGASKLCKQNTAALDAYVYKVLISKTTPETICQVVGMCNNDKLDNIMDLNNMKKKDQPKPKQPLLGSEQCTWGPSYWCSNFSTGRQCKATHHCIQKVWSKMNFPEDKDSICNICINMVTQARDQLLSNETQEELREVFEGSCKLIPIRLVAKECIHLADDFVPELVETLSSQMNPQAVCSVAGLCNNEKIDRMLDNYHEQLKLHQDCEGCSTAVSALRTKFDSTSYDDFLVSLLQVCRKMDSLSDSCSMLAFAHYEHIRAALRQELRPQGVCLLSGQCSARFHSHDLYDFPRSPAPALQGEVPCEFCESLVNHLRDVVTANTTEIEFYKVLEGICKQTGSFKTECLHLAEQYYREAYAFLVREMDPKEVCALMGLCEDRAPALQVAPLVTGELEVKVFPMASRLIGEDEANSYKIVPAPSAKKQSSVPLPLERMLVQLPRGKSACSFCQHFLHYLQVELSDAATEEKIRAAVDSACDRLPQSVGGECRQFVSEYGPAVVALLVQQIDPASVCPALGVCPSAGEVRLVAATAAKSNCPLCLFAVEQLETMLAKNRSEESIRLALDNLCGKLSPKLKAQCVGFVDTYSKQLIELIVADLDSQEICVYLRLCSASARAADPLGVSPLSSPAIDRFHAEPRLRGDRNNSGRRPVLPASMLENGDIETNEIPDATVNGRPVKARKDSPKPVCVLCEFVLKQIDDEIKDKHNEDEIKAAVHGVCKRMPKSVRDECDQFVEKYADLVISLLAQELDPNEVCEELKLCPPASPAAVRQEVLDCAICQTVAEAVKKVITNDKVDRDIVHIVEKSCAILPAKYNARCHTLLEIYGDSVVALIEQFGSKAVCRKIGLCASASDGYVHMRSSKRVH